MAGYKLVKTLSGHTLYECIICRNSFQQKKEARKCCYGDKLSLGFIKFRHYKRRAARIKKHCTTKYLNIPNISAEILDGSRKTKNLFKNHPSMKRQERRVVNKTSQYYIPCTHKTTSNSTTYSTFTYGTSTNGE